MNPSQASTAPGAPAPDPADRHPDLARRRPRQELAERHEIGEARSASHGSRATYASLEVAEVRDRPAERGEPEAGRGREDLRGREDGAGSRSRSRRCAAMFADHRACPPPRSGLWLQCDARQLGLAPLRPRFPPAKDRSGQDRSQSRDHARVHRVQAAQLPDEQVEAEHARPVRGEEVLPLVREPHAPPGDPLAPWPGSPAPAAPAARRLPGVGGRARATAPARRQVRPVRRPRARPARSASAGAGSARSSPSRSASCKKVEWPGRRQLFSATVVVIIAVAVVGAYLYVADEAFSRLVRDVLLNL